MVQQFQFNAAWLIFGESTTIHALIIAEK